MATRQVLGAELLDLRGAVDVGAQRLKGPERALGGVGVIIDSAELTALAPR